MAKLEFAFFDAGGGHRAAATALELAIRDAGRPWEIELTNVQELLDEIDILRKYGGIRIQDFYNGMLRTGWTLGSEYLMRVLQAVIRLNHGRIVRAMKKQWAKSSPDVLVSFIPHFNREMEKSFHALFPERASVTIITDIADFPPHFWMERTTQYVVCGSPRAVEQARAMGIADERVFHASGMILQPKFYAAPVQDRSSERRKLGLAADVPTAMIMFGGHGSSEILEIVERLEKESAQLQLIVICGKNEELARTLRAKQSRMPIFVEGFTKEIPYYMDLADFFIGKPGPGSVSEAMARHLPVIVACNAWTLPQERYNATWITENGVGIALGSFREVAGAVKEMLEPEKFARFRENTRELKNMAVYEIQEFLAGVIERHSAGVASRRAETSSGDVETAAHAAT
ncbi:MAG TPA: glycosyltransferase [Candidatus Acidoferrales bacterium]|nr:glycosyltransferase [Candidatus Acidoferrales bacterium]